MVASVTEMRRHAKASHTRKVDRNRFPPTTCRRGARFVHGLLFNQQDIKFGTRPNRQATFHLQAVVRIPKEGLYQPPKGTSNTLAQIFSSRIHSTHHLRCHCPSQRHIGQPYLTQVGRQAPARDRDVPIAISMVPPKFPYPGTTIHRWSGNPTVRTAQTRKNSSPSSSHPSDPVTHPPEEDGASTPTVCTRVFPADPSARSSSRNVPFPLSRRKVSQSSPYFVSHVPTAGRCTQSCHTIICQ